MRVDPSERFKGDRAEDFGLETISAGRKRRERIVEARPTRYRLAKLIRYGRRSDG